MARPSSSDSPAERHAASRAWMQRQRQNRSSEERQADTIRRRQFPLRLTYASTFNSAQGLTLDRVFLDLRIKPFGHGRLYNALTRVRRRSDIRILTLPPSNIVDPAAAAFTTTHVVYN